MDGYSRRLIFSRAAKASFSTGSDESHKRLKKQCLPDFNHDRERKGENLWKSAFAVISSIGFCWRARRLLIQRRSDTGTAQLSTNNFVSGDASFACRAVIKDEESLSSKVYLHQARNLREVWG